MSKADSAKVDLDKALIGLFDAERRVRELHDEIAENDAEKLCDAVAKSISVASKEPDAQEASMRLERLSALLGELETARAVDLLIDILATGHEDAVSAAGERLESLAFNRFKEVAKGVERALKRLPTGSQALSELPYLLAEVPEPGVVKLLELFLSHEDPDAVAAAIEVSVEVGDPSIAASIEKLKSDKRTVEMSDENEDTAEVTIAELAADALAIFEAMAEEADADEKN